MIFTAEQQEKLVAKYSEGSKTTAEILSFIDGMNAVVELSIKIQNDQLI